MRRMVAAAVGLGLLLGGDVVRAQRGVNKLPVRQVEAALLMDTGVLKIRLTLATNEALDYEIRDERTITNVLKFIEVGSNGTAGLAAEISTDGRTLRALHLVPGSRR